MKIISLNIWNGRMRDKLKDFFIKYKNEIDIFCFQEVFQADNAPVHEDFIDTPKKIQNILGGEYSMLTDNNGLVICLNNKCKIKDWGIREVFSHDGFKKNLLWVSLGSIEKEYFIANIHGIWVKDWRVDTEERLWQSEITMETLSGRDNVILCGDFNLLPNTQSIAMLEERMINLIKVYNISTTRTPLRKQTNLKNEAEEFADYIFVSQDIEVKKFTTLPDEVSDHSALLLEV